MIDLPMAANGVVVNGECEFVTDATIAKQGDLLKRYLRANRKALEWSRDHPEETGHIIAEAYPELDEKQVVINHEAYMHYVFNDVSAKVGVGGFDLAELKTTFEAVKGAQNVTSKADLATFIDTRFLPK
jgi:NitT/TauT family transport system substrate-binding protein